MRWLIALSLLVLAAAGMSPAWSQDNAARSALVIGNANYLGSSVPPPNAIKDARAIAEELRRSEFQVEFKENLNREEMQRSIDAFINNIQSGATALIYFNGIGVQVAKHNYLVPINASIWTEFDVRREGFDLDVILAEMARKGAKVKIAIVDAARDNPIERRFRLPQIGLAEIKMPEGGLAIAATAPGTIRSDVPDINDDGTGAATLFASELIKQIQTPNLKAEDAFGRARDAVSRASNGQQVPWVASKPEGNFMFKKPPPAPVVPPKPQPPSQPLQAGSKPGDIFKDCGECGELVVVPAGSFEMGSTYDFEEPVHRVTIAKPFAIGRREVTFVEWDTCVLSGGCNTRLEDRGWGRGSRPALGVTWLEAQEFLKWLSTKTGQRYRLPSEAEWEYAARARSTTPYWWGAEIGSGQANCRECGTGQPQRTSPVGSFKPNAFGLYDTAGNVAEWVEDCWNDDYRGAPADGSAWVTGQCRLRVLRGGGFDSQARYLRTTSRFRYDNNVRFFANGFRVVRELQ